MDWQIYLNDDVTQYETVVTATDHGFPPQARGASLLISLIWMIIWISLM